MKPDHATELTARIALARTYRLFAYLGWTELIYNHISLRVPGADNHFLINPFGLHYSEVTARNLVKVDLDGKVIESSEGYGINPAGFLIHGALHRYVPTAHCVMHTHTTAGIAVACTQSGLKNHNFYSAQLHNLVAYHTFEGITLHAGEGERIIQSMGDKPLLILRNHGLLSRGETLAQAFAYLWTLNRACELQLAIDSMGSASIPVSDAIASQATKDSLQFDVKLGAGNDVLSAMTRVAIKQMGDVI